MVPLPTAHIIHASDAPQHLGKLKEILEKLKAENRIADFITLSSDNSLTSLQDQVREDDLVITLLTYDLEPRKEEIESMLREVKTQTPGLKIAEIIVDHVPYENEFITFPADLKPIRSREDMDAVWSDIEQSLKQIFPVQETEHVPPADWKKYLKYAIPAIVIIALLLWWKPWEGKVVADFAANIRECEVPCEVNFDNTSKNADIYEWSFGDGTTSSEANPSYRYEEPGDYTVTLTASKNGQSDEKTLSITMSAPVPPVADFSSNKTECEAPCTVDFNNTSENANTYQWGFGDGRNSTERNPSHTYNQPGNFTVKLIAQKGNQKDEKENTLKITYPANSNDFEVTDASINLLRRRGNEVTETDRDLSVFGTCPHKFKFKGTITVNEAGTVYYQWVRSDGRYSPRKKLYFSEAGSQAVETISTLGEDGESGNSYNLIQQLRVIAQYPSRSRFNSNKIECSIKCR